MRIKPFHLKRAGSRAWPVEDDASLSVVYGNGGGSTLDVTGWATIVCLPLQGIMQVRSNGLARSVYTGELLVTDDQTRTVLVGHANVKWLALLGGRRAWALVLSHIKASGAQLLPDLARADHETRRQAIAVVRAAYTLNIESAVNAFADKLAGLQAGLHEAIARCPGRTWLAKRQVFLRLQRVRNYINACSDQDMDIDTLARMANYSSCHFLRAFRAVYLTTPHAYLVDRRLHHALRLLRSGNLAVTEVAMASGFENRSAFSRLFHERFGATAQEMRRRRDLPILDVSPARRNRSILATN